MMFWYGVGWAWWQAGPMWLAMIAFWGLLIWAIYALVTGCEIDADEYRRPRDVLKGGTGHATAGSGGGR